MAAASFQWAHPDLNRGLQVPYSLFGAMAVIAVKCIDPDDAEDAVDCLSEADGGAGGPGFGIGGTSQWSIGAVVTLGPCSQISTPLIPAYADLGSVQAPYAIGMSGDIVECRSYSGPQSGWEFSVTGTANIVDAAYGGGVPFLSKSGLTFDLPEDSWTDTISERFDNAPGSETDRTQCEAVRAVALGTLTGAGMAWVSANLPSGALVPCTADLALIPMAGGGYLLELPTMDGLCELSINLIGAWAFSGTFSVTGVSGVSAVAKIEGGSVLITALPL